MRLTLRARYARSNLLQAVLSNREVLANSSDHAKQKNRHKAGPFCLARPEGLCGASMRLTLRARYARSKLLLAVLSNHEVLANSSDHAKQKNRHKAGSFCLARPEGLCGASMRLTLRARYARSKLLLAVLSNHEVLANSSDHAKQKNRHKAGSFCLARPEGLEPPTTWFEARYSIQLSYGRVFVDRRDYKSIWL